MVSVMEYKRRVLWGVSIIWLFTAVITSVSEALELDTASRVTAKCGDKVTLTCKASSPNQLDIKSFLWVTKGETVCNYADGHLLNDTQCEYSQNTLTLTIPNIKPVQEGQYRCKIYTTAGVKESLTSISIDNCVGSFTFSENNTHATCVFRDVYYAIGIFWYHGNAEETPILTETTSDKYSMQTIWSTLEVDKRNLSQPYKCCLFWLSADITDCQTLKLNSSGSIVRLQWMFVMLEILVVKLLI